MGKEMEHTATVLLFDRAGKFAGTDRARRAGRGALAALKKLVA